MIKAVLFDLDGVLIETEYRHIMIKADICREYGLNWTDKTFYIAAARRFTEVLPLLFPEKTPEELKAVLLGPLGDPGIFDRAPAGVLSSREKIEKDNAELGFAIEPLAPL